MNDQVPKADKTQDIREDESEAAFAALKPEQRQAIVSRLHKGDRLLQKLVELANRDVGLPVTLSVGGHLVTGQMVSIDKYFDRLSENLGAVENEVVRQSLRDWLDHQRPEPDDKDPLSSLPPNYIHLIDARYLTGSQWTPSLNGSPLVWRGKVASVDGFTLGSLSATP